MKWTQLPRFWLFYLSENIFTELEWEDKMRILPSVGDATEIYSDSPFSALVFDNYEWLALPKGYAQYHLWTGREWKEGPRTPTGKLPAGPPDTRGFDITWGCRSDWALKNLPGLYSPNYYGIRLTTNIELHDMLTTRVHSCAPAWNPNHPVYRVNYVERLSACDNRPGLKKIYLDVLDNVLDGFGNPVQGVKVRFTTEPSFGIAWDHPAVWGLSDRFGRIEWDTPGVPTYYLLWIEDDEDPLVWNIRTDLGNEYCKPAGSPIWSGNRPVNRPGIYSYRIEIACKSE